MGLPLRFKIDPVIRRSSLVMDEVEGAGLEDEREVDGRPCDAVLGHRVGGLVGGSGRWMRSEAGTEEDAGHTWVRVSSGDWMRNESGRVDSAKSLALFAVVEGLLEWPDDGEIGTATPYSDRAGRETVSPAMRRGLRAGTSESLSGQFDACSIKKASNRCVELPVSTSE